MAARTDYTVGFAEKAKELFPDNLELHQDIAEGKGMEVGMAINKIIGRGYNPSPADDVELIRTGQANKVADEAQKYVQWQAFYSQWADLFRAPRKHKL